MNQYIACILVIFFQIIFFLRYHNFHYCFFLLDKTIIFISFQN
ncbi:hypothetical protein NEIPOLOT_01161 [Neisseria polysaccharea ATCC 43768]|nr:hypothetical protein NEIPOLOT_01161 [Neisseria polysaccharea ATCC 43768]